MTQVSELHQFTLLSKEEKQHLLNQGIGTIEDANKAFSQLAAQRHSTRHGPGSEPCWNCYRIAYKLGFPI